MKIKAQYALDASHRVQDFLDEQAAVVGALKDSAARQQLDAAVAQTESHDKDQSSAVLEMAGQKNLQLSLETDLRKAHMQPIANFARAKLVGVPDFAALTKSGSALKGRGLVRAARAMATAGAPYADRFAPIGFPADTIAQLGAAADKLDAVIDGRGNLQVRKAGSTKGITEQTKLAREAVTMLSAVIDRQFAKDKTFLAAWRSAKRIVAKPGVVRGGGAAPIPTASATPAPVATSVANAPASEVTATPKV